MYRGETVAVVIPAYNEAAFVGGVIETVPDFVDRVYPVDDASTDDTWAEIEAAAERVNRLAADHEGPFDRRVVPLRHRENRGVGGAIKTGYLRAREDRIDVTAVMGGDAQMRPEALELIVDPVASGRADYAKGNRLQGAEYHAEMPRLRYVGNQLLTYLTRIASGYWDVGDPQNGYTAISLEALETVDVGDLYEFYGYCNDLLVKLNVAGMRVVDVPSEARYDEEESHIDYRTYVPRVSGMLARNFGWRIWHSYVRRGLHPAALFAGLAALTGFAGAARALRRARGGDASGVASLASLCVTAVAATLAVDRERDSHLDGRAERRREPLEGSRDEAEPAAASSEAAAEPSEAGVEPPETATDPSPAPADPSPAPNGSSATQSGSSPASSGSAADQRESVPDARKADDSGDREVPVHQQD